MPKKNKERRIKYGNSIEEKLLETLIDYSDTTGIPQTKLLDRALTLLFEELNIPIKH